jgi:hypothetical protein
LTLAEVVIQPGPVPVILGHRRDQRDRGRRPCHVAGPAPDASQAGEPLALGDRDEIPGLPVLRGRCAAAGFQQPVEVLGGDRPAGELPHVAA